MKAELELRPFQAAAVQSLRVGLKESFLRQMLYSPTGSGKSVMATGLIKGARLKNKRVAFLVNRVQLVEQMSAVLRRYGIPHGVIQGENTRREYEHVLVCSIQTVAKRGLPDVDFIVIDEAHAVAGSKDYRGIIESLAGKPVIGLSASPFSKGLGKHYDSLGGPLFERMVIAASIGELIEDGFLVDCDIYAPSEPDMSGIKQVRNKFGEMDWSDMDVGNATDKAELIGDIVSHWFKLARNTSTVVFAANIAHSKHIVEQFCAAGVSAAHLDCYADTDERRDVLRRFESGEIRIVSNSALLAEGWDAPFCETLILARPTKSLIRYLQMVGRVLRPFDGKDKALVLDHSGTVKRLGFPTDDLPLELDDGKPRSASKQAQEKEAPLPKACPSCAFMKPPKVHECPRCGFAPEKRSDVEVGEGQLELIVKGKKKAPKMEKQAFYSQLLAYCSMRGYSEGWAAHAYRDYFDVWPKGLEKTAMEPTEEMNSWIKSRNIRNAKRREKEATRAAA
jgi:superfamily II DNA or RNA helicase